MAATTSLLLNETEELRARVKALEEENRGLRQQYACLRTMNQLLHEYAYVGRLDARGQLLPEWVCDSFEKGLGFSLDSIRKRGWKSLIHPDDLPEVERHLAGV